jgi:hypothetical protein
MVLCGAVTFMMLAPSALVGQGAGRGSLSGRILDMSTGQPIAGATITALASGRSTTSDSTGAYRLTDLGGGLQRFLVAAAGFPRASLVLPFAKDEGMIRDLALDSTRVAVADSASNRPQPPGAGAQPLGAVTVEAAPSRDNRFRDFDRRRATGRGQYLVREQIETAGYFSLQDAMRNLRGVQLNCSGNGCQIHMARAQNGCFPEYVVDERVDNMFGPFVPVRDIEGIEVYTGPSDVAGEFAGINAGCGVVVIWTRNGPPKKSKKKDP